MNLSFLPAVNATLNGLAGGLLVTGFVLIKRRRITAHRNVMLTAFATSCLFLVCYITYHISTHGHPTQFHRTGLPHHLYMAMLITHTILAVTVPIWAIWLIRLAFTGRFEKHRRVAKFAFPIWLYVSVTGVLIYVVLYHLNPKA